MTPASLQADALRFGQACARAARDTGSREIANVELIATGDSNLFFAAADVGSRCITSPVLLEGTRTPDIEVYILNLFRGAAQIAVRQAGGAL